MNTGAGRAGGGDTGGRTARGRVLVILHQEHSTPGRLGWWLRSAGYELDIRKPRFGDALPETLEGHAGAIIFGGPMSANDPDDFVKTEIDWIGVPLAERKPFLGVCLGAQMLAKKLGATVAPDPDGVVECGYYPIEVTETGRALGDWPCHFYQWHREGFTLPSGARHLAATPAYPNQAISYGPAALGVQFHPEITYVLVNRWTTAAAHRLANPGAKPRHEHFEGHHRHTSRVGAWLDRMMPMWLAGGLEAANAPCRADRGAADGDARLAAE
ncbi:MAG: glutamine amidotransferase [Rhizobiales bacterium]|nr:glutamine amidotransferase [Hyphomicrobiales bacterium]